jgi:hypothetical protein
VACLEESSCGDESEEGPADVCEEGAAAAVRVDGEESGVGFDEWVEEPEAEEDPGGEHDVEGEVAEVSEGVFDVVPKMARNGMLPTMWSPLP